MNQKLEKFNKIMAEVTDLGRAEALLGWDQQVNMPRGGAEDRGNILETIAGLMHDKFTSAEVGELLEDLKPYAESLDPRSDDACVIKRVAHEYEKEVKVSTQWVAEFAKETTIGQSVWEEAKTKNDFALFLPHLEKIVELRRQYADFFKPWDHVYDPLLDDFEPGLKTSEVKEIFGKLRPQQVELLKAIAAKPVIDDSFLHIPYDEKGQWDFGVDVITHFGYDWNRGRQDKAVHPFTTGFGIDDVRITTRFDPERAASALFSTMHEGGHALYEQGVSHTLARTPLATGTSMAVHESQSRMWENLIGRSMPFWKFFYPKLVKLFPSQLGNVSLDAFYKGINKVEPSLIRVEADEATYNLHVMLRLELEIALMEGSLKVKDLPDAWNTRMKDYLGVVPSKDSEGVLQDVHWSTGSIGYFPTYALGNLVSSQLWEKINQDIPTLEAQIEQGKFDELLSWLRLKIHQHGAKFEPQVLVKEVTGSSITPEPYIRYLTTKYSEIYNL
ncbi:MAG: carboxypeptidase M32 [Anaerolineae bacterium]|jgi:carboxypeptidase Taq|nr:carboxypeptidase M32 [Anaerolineae bacterium]PKO01903.1 MAG: carboxypeptidase [Chloroflexi bacterium HGW-Chloroflexi-5]